MHYIYQACQEGMHCYLFAIQTSHLIHAAYPELILM